MQPGLYVLGVIFVLIMMSFVSVQQGTVAVTTVFGKFRRIMRPGLNLKIPLIEHIFRRISIQNRSMDLKFQAITLDQANVYFTSMLLYSVLNQEEKTIENVAFKFMDDKNFMQALIRS